VQKKYYLYLFILVWITVVFFVSRSITYSKSRENSETMIIRYNLNQIRMTIEGLLADCVVQSVTKELIEDSIKIYGYKSLNYKSFIKKERVKKSILLSTFIYIAIMVYYKIIYQKIQYLFSALRYANRVRRDSKQLPKYLSYAILTVAYFCVLFFNLTQMPEENYDYIYDYIYYEYQVSEKKSKRIIVVEKFDLRPKESMKSVLTANGYIDRMDIHEINGLLGKENL